MEIQTIHKNEINCKGCQILLQQQLLHQYPITNKKSDIISVQLQHVCKQCYELFHNIYIFVTQNQLTYHGYKNIINNDLNQIKLQNEKNIYKKVLQDYIKKTKLYYIYEQPKTLQYFIYLCCMKNQKNQSLIMVQQIHQKLKNITYEIMSNYSISMAQMESLIIIIHTLLAQMNINEVYKYLTNLAKIILMSNNINWNDILLIYEQNQNNFQQIKINNESNQKLNFLRNKNLIPINKIFQKIKTIIYLYQNTNKQLDFILNNINQYLFKTNYKSYNSNNKIQFILYKQIEKQDILIQKKNKKNKLKQKQYYQIILEIQQQRNYYQLILKQLINQRTNINSYINLLEQKNRKQKDQYINKIIKLNLEIEMLKDNLENKNNNCQQNTNIEKKPSILQTQQIKTIQGNNNHNDLDKQDFVNINSQLQSILILSDIVNFNQGISKKSQSFSQSYHLNNNQQLSTKIVQEIEILIHGFNDINNRYKQSQFQKQRLLEILSHKQLRFMELIHQKDQIIQNYENALWMLENKRPVSQGPLTERINNLIDNYIATNKNNQKMNEKQLHMKKKTKKKKKNSDISKELNGFHEKNNIQQRDKQENNNKMKDKQIDKIGDKTKDCTIY